jgi:hypothetical protein
MLALLTKTGRGTLPTLACAIVLGDPPAVNSLDDAPLRDLIARQATDWR